MNCFMHHHYSTEGMKLLAKVKLNVSENTQIFNDGENVLGTVYKT